MSTKISIQINPDSSLFDWIKFQSMKYIIIINCHLIGKLKEEEIDAINSNSLDIYCIINSLI